MAKRHRAAVWFFLSFWMQLFSLCGKDVWGTAQSSYLHLHVSAASPFTYHLETRYHPIFKMSVHKEGTFCLLARKVLFLRLSLALLVRFQLETSQLMATSLNKVISPGSSCCAAGHICSCSGCYHLSYPRSHPLKLEEETTRNHVLSGGVSKPSLGC